MNALDVLKYGQATFHNALQIIPESDWEHTGACGVWSVKDIVSHIASYEQLLGDILAGFAGSSEATPYMDLIMNGGFEGFNDAQVDQRRHLPAADIVAELDAAHARVTTLAAQISPEVWRQVGVIPWYGNEYALDDYVVYANYGHKREHSAQIEMFRDRLHNLI